jgi:hypothetical protein
LRYPARRTFAGVALFSLPAIVLLVTGCGGRLETPQIPTFDAIEVADPADVDAVVFLVGDGGNTDRLRSPLLIRLQQDIERWSQALARDSAVSVIFLGDNVYPRGVRDSTHPGFPTDTARLWNQIRLLGGPAAVEHATTGWFLSGNHDWGNMRGERGIQRLVNMQEQLSRASESGPHVAMLPPAGTPGPIIRDLRHNVRIVLIDTNWYVQGPSALQKTEFFDRLEDALRTAGDRDVIVAAHHPWETSGPHGVIEGGRAFGLYYLLEKSGTLVQDLNSPVYRDFRRRFRHRVLEVGRPPLIFAAGHDHSLQVLGGTFEGDPVHVLISGAASKLSPVSQIEGLRYAASRPGYMMLVFRKDGRLNLFVVAGDPDLLLCPDGDEGERSVCMEEGLTAFETVYSGVMREPTVDVRPEAEDPAEAEAAIEDEEEEEEEEEEAPEEPDEPVPPNP